MKERIILLIKAKNFTAAQFADEIGVQKSGISHIISGRNNPSLDFVQKILLRFPEVNMDWLIMGKGPMFSGDTVKQTPPVTSLFAFQENDIQTPDLFTTEISPAFELKKESSIEENRVINSDLIQEKSDNIFEKNIPSEKIVTTEKRTEEEEIKIPAKVQEPVTGINKKIERVLFFYTDKTFIEFHPES
jgi:transcriptional regulator with XRE-family HTH domain